MRLSNRPLTARQAAGLLISLFAAGIATIYIVMMLGPTF